MILNTTKMTYSSSLHYLQHSLSLIQAVNPSGEGSATPHGLFFSSHLDPQRPLVWGSGWWDLAMRWCVYISSSAFPRFRRPYSGHLLVAGQVRTTSVLTNLSFDCNARDSNGMANVIISFPDLTCDTKHPSEHSHLSSFKKPLLTSSQGHASAP